jgi:hypothetical protein
MLEYRAVIGMLTLSVVGRRPIADCGDGRCLALYFISGKVSARGFHA